MKNPLQRLIGQNLISISQCDHNIGLKFSEANVAVFNPVEISDHFCYEGSVLEAPSFEIQARCLFRFSHSRELSIFLKEEDFIGPEASSLFFSGGAIVVAPQLPNIS